MKYLRSGLHCRFLLLFLSFLSVSLLAAKIKATSTFYENCELYATGTFIYVESTWGTPVNNLNGQTLNIYFDAESERCILMNPYLSNASEASVSGYIENGMEFTIPFGGRLEVQQTHYSGSYNDRNATAYYDFQVEEIQTNLLYRAERNDWYIKAICLSLLIFSAICIIKAVRHD